MKTGELNTGLSYYQERQWVSAINHYGESILNKSLLSNDQKIELIKQARLEYKR